ncbi:MAG TPA: hypothetical protein PL097_07180 [Dysgonamonadaceae bacterium]|nr:hypothetical protein [Dysgonamonadaceae bacterium]HRU13379.1 hypothetical protein [Dysgonamonadaceae bacterium]
MKYRNIREEELKNKVAQDYFWLYDCSKIIGNVDFCVSMHKTSKEATEQESLLWAEAKKGSSDIYNSLTQLILTIGKARTFDKFLPPPMLGAFDGEKMAFVPYNEIHDVFYLNDFNWTVTPSNYSTKEFQLIYRKVKNIIDQNLLLFYFEKDDNELKKFIKSNFIVGHFGITKIKIDKNNFMVIYNKWLQEVKPSIAINWDVAKKSGIIDGDFYLADLLSSDNQTLKEKLFVLLKHDHYELDRKIDESGMFSRKQADFTDGQKAHTRFWNKYERPPKEEYWDYIVERRDLLVPQDIRERKGSFFTPQIWVELSQKYIAEVLGEDWQDEYYVWDCAAGTGNLLAGLTNKYNIWASTLDQQDVEVMHDRINNGANLLHDHVFQFDFLNDDFSKLPLPLKNIINDPEKRKKLVVYINPPYAEVSSIGIKGKAGVNKSKAHDKYSEKIGTAGREIYILFLARLFDELNGCIIGEFSKLKALQGSAFSEFRDFFKAELIKSFVVPAYTFDNVKGNFPIGFKIWNTSSNKPFDNTISDVFDETGNLIGQKTFSVIEKSDFINKWISKYKVKNDFIGFLAGTNGNDFQQNGIVYILNKKEQMANPRGIWISSQNLIPASIYYAVRRCVDQTWLNDRDQFLYPNDGWETDTEFQNDCLAYTIFSNNISSSFGANHWIPFTEQEVNAREKFESNFMTNFLKGKPKLPQKSFYTLPILFESEESYNRAPIKFSEEATAVFDAGRELWKYYHQQPDCNVNASLYDIREYFQGRNEKGKMNNRSEDETYMQLIGNLREKLRQLSKKIEPKVYEYGFLKR